MRATGIVRRIDDLGRVVIPKEIRRNMRINAGDPLEIFLDSNGVVFKKYNPIGEVDVEKLACVIGEILPVGVHCAIYDNSFRKLCGSLKFADDGTEVEAEFIESINVDGDIVGYLAFDADNFDRHLAIKIASAYMRN